MPVLFFEGPWSHHDGEAAPLSAERVRAAAKDGLAAAAIKAKLFADHEEREIQRLSANIINHQVCIITIQSFTRVLVHGLCQVMA